MTVPDGPRWPVTGVAGSRGRTALPTSVALEGAVGTDPPEGKRYTFLLAKSQFTRFQYASMYWGLELR
jgi:hypothetical protein